MGALKLKTRAPRSSCGAVAVALVRCHGPVSLVSVWTAENCSVESRTEETRPSRNEVERVCCGPGWAAGQRGSRDLLWGGAQARRPACCWALPAPAPRLLGRVGASSPGAPGVGLSNLRTPLVTWLCLPAPFSPAEASEIMKSIGEAIQYLHSINIAHRDVKVPATYAAAPAPAPPGGPGARGLRVPGSSCGPVAWLLGALPRRPCPL